ncbi:helix-turn-helix domain-containing protein [Cellulomonas citrea]|uniref:helix-turn-helix domain-containing protein n=1 Tax=Cellulomonas citrea TaxID=1909423 RepID=UPI00135BF66F|nr:XRE family transcriptional regulator [Cellulomonas citrea]
MSQLGEVISTARRAKGWTQETLAERAGVTQATLSRYESGLRTPDDEALAHVARALGVTPALLREAGRIEGGIAVNAHMRRQKTTPVTVWRELEAQLNLVRLHAAHLGEEVALRAERSVPSFDTDETSPADAARLLRAQWRMPVGPIGNLTDWMESAGVLVVESNFGAGPRVDGLSQWANEHPIVMINANMPTDRLRFTLAHELGHLVLHSIYIDDQAEQQANEFAAELLLPAEQISHYLRRLRIGDLIELKRTWGVSIAALVERAHGLNLITGQQRASMYKMLNARGLRNPEPASEDIAPEHPRLGAHIGESLAARGLTPPEIAEIAGFATPADNFLFSGRGLRVVS